MPLLPSLTRSCRYQRELPSGDADDYLAARRRSNAGFYIGISSLWHDCAPLAAPFGGGSMRAPSIHLFLFASSLVPSSPGGLPGVRAAESGRRVPVGAWVYPESNEKRDDVLVTLAKRGVGLLGESHEKPEH